MDDAEFFELDFGFAMDVLIPCLTTNIFVESLGLGFPCESRAWTGCTALETVTNSFSESIPRMFP